MTDPDFTLRPERAEDEPALKELAEATFGPGRFARTAYRVREGAAVAGELSLTAWCGDELAGSIRFSAICIGAAGGALLVSVYFAFFLREYVNALTILVWSLVLNMLAQRMRKRTPAQAQ